MESARNILENLRQEVEERAPSSAICLQGVPPEYAGVWEKVRNKFELISFDQRRYGVGASEFGALFGQDPNRDALTVYMTKKIMPEPQPPTSWQRRGKIFEQAQGQLFAVDHDVQIDWCDRTHRRKDLPFIFCTPDAFLSDRSAGLDCKWVFYAHRHLWGPGPDGEDCPIHVQLQMQEYMDAFEMDHWHCAAMIDGMPRYYVLHRDREVIQTVHARVEEWWRRYLVGDDRPDAETLASANLWLKHAFPRNILDMLDADEVQARLLNEYAIARAKIDELESQKDALEVKLKTHIGVHDGLQWPHGKFTWKLARGSKDTDWETIALGLLNGRQDRDEIIAKHTTPKPGVRKIYFKYYGAK